MGGSSKFFFLDRGDLEWVALEWVDLEWVDLEWEDPEWVDLEWEVWVDLVMEWEVWVDLEWEVWVEWFMAELNIVSSHHNIQKLSVTPTHKDMDLVDLDKDMEWVVQCQEVDQ